jgi:hypothetical protein
MPIDAVPASHGTILLKHEGGPGEPPRAHVVSVEEREKLLAEHRYRVEHLGHADTPFVLFVPHHLTCAKVAAVRAGALKGQEPLF